MMPISRCYSPARGRMVICGRTSQHRVLVYSRFAVQSWEEQCYMCIKVVLTSLATTLTHQGLPTHREALCMQYRSCTSLFATSPPTGTHSYRVLQRTTLYSVLFQLQRTESRRKRCVSPPRHLDVDRFPSLRDVCGHSTKRDCIDGANRGIKTHAGITTETKQPHGNSHKTSTAMDWKATGMLGAGTQEDGEIRCDTPLTPIVVLFPLSQLHSYRLCV
jgi:hypothetical protein